jgi:hypothetical protein
MCTVYQHNGTDEMHFSFSFLRFKGLYMFRITCLSLGGASQTALGVLRAYKVSETAIVAQSTDIIRTQYTRCRLWAPPEDEQVMLETCKGPWFSINWMKSTLRLFHYTMMHGQQNIKFCAIVFKNKCKTCIHTLQCIELRSNMFRAPRGSRLEKR